MTGFALVGGIMGIVGFVLALRAITAISYLQKKVERLENELGDRSGSAEGAGD